MSEKRGIDMKSNFHILFKTYKDKQMLKHQQLAKQTVNYETEHAETSEFEQKPILWSDEFNDENFTLKKRKLQSLLKNLKKIR